MPRSCTRFGTVVRFEVEVDASFAAPSSARESTSMVDVCACWVAALRAVSTSMKVSTPPAAMSSTSTMMTAMSTLRMRRERFMYSGGSGSPLECLPCLGAAFAGAASASAASSGSASAKGSSCSSTSASSARSAASACISSDLSLTFPSILSRFMAAFRLEEHVPHGERHHRHGRCRYDDLLRERHLRLLDILERRGLIAILRGRLCSCRRGARGRRLRLSRRLIPVRGGAGRWAYRRRPLPP